MARVQTVKKARKARKKYGIEKGDTYYWWKFRFGAIHYSKTYPKPSQLTQSAFLGTLYSIQEDLSFDRDNLSDSVQNLTGEIEQLRDECQDNLDNMPEHLQDTSSSGELLTERIEALEEWINGLEGVDLEVDGNLKGEAKEERINGIIQELEACECSL